MEKENRCPSCGQTNVIKYGLNELKKQRYRCKNPECEKKTFLKDYSQKGYEEETRTRVIDMTLDGSGVRAIGRVLGISANTVTAIIKKKPINCRQSIKPTSQPELKQHKRVQRFG